MSKKDQAYELFNQGREPGDIALLPLGLRKESLRKYYRKWKNLPPVVAAVEAVAPVTLTRPTEVQLGSLRIATKFEFKGEKYRVGNKMEDSVEVDKFREVISDEETIWQHLAHLTLSPNVIVRPIK